jgi:hypothetical protein
MVAFPLVLFRLAIVLSVLRFTDSDYPFGIFKLFFKVLDTDYEYSKIEGQTTQWPNEKGLKEKQPSTKHHT